MKNKIISTTIALFLFACTGLRAQQYPVSSIPAELKEGADAVVRLEQCSFVQKDKNEAIETVTIVITVLNERGDSDAQFLISQDKFSELKSFSGLLLSESGKTVKKLGKGDLNHSQISDALARDNQWTFYSYSAPSYPYTVVYNYEIRYKNGVAHYPPFFPQGFGIAVEKAEYKLVFPETMSLRYKGNSLVDEPRKEVVKTDSVFTWSVAGLKAVEQEPLCPSVISLTPFVLISPREFCMEKECGDMSSWQSTGEFQTQLLNGKDALLPETKAKIREIVAGAKDERETVKRLYEYLQQSTRYVSIQLGIGGWMPIAADKVAKSGFGDCKALSNYMKAMLEEVGIPSRYTTVNTKQKRIHKDFSSMFQFDHAILMVPLANDTLWLECTSQELPFNYVHSGISGHDALLANGENSALCRIRDTADAENKQSNNLTIHLDKEGAIRSEVRSSYRNQEIEKMQDFVLSLPERDKTNRLAERFSVARPQIGAIQTEYVRSEIPEIRVSYTMDAEKYASITGSRLFVPANPLRSYFSSTFSATHRKLDVLLNSNINRTDTIHFHIPEGYKIESRPKPFVLESAFGKYTFLVQEREGGEILFIHQLSIPSGRYKPEEYPSLKDFFRKIDSAMGGRMVVVPI